MDLPEVTDIPGVRGIVLRRARELGLSLATISRAIGHSSSYVHQYVHKGTPQRLDGDVRRMMAQILRVDETMLDEPARSPAKGRPSPALVASNSLEPMVAPAVPAMALRQVPLFHEGDRIAAQHAERWALPWLPGGAPAACAIWIDTPHGTLKPGDIAYAKSDIPPRPGDTVIVLTAQERIAAIGTLTTIDAETVEVASNTVTTTFTRAEHRILKVVGVAFP